VVGSSKHEQNNNENHQLRILVVTVTVFKGDIMREINRMGGGGPAVLLLVDMEPKRAMTIVFADLALITYDAGKELAAVQGGAHRQHCVVLHIHHRRRAKDKEAHWLTSESRIQSEFFTFIPPSQTHWFKPESKIQSDSKPTLCCQHHAVLNVHHLRRAKDKEAHWLT
jgi:hypothetical protein